MNFPDEAPRLNPLPFIIADIVLLATAVFIAIESPAPLATLPLVAMTACVCLGAFLACMPVVLNYTRRRDALMDERQDQLVALTQTAAAASHQLGIAASNLHNIAETTARMLKHADTLPARIQEKTAEFKVQLNEVNIAENEALEEEIAALRNSETERLETALAAIKQFADEIIAREATAQKHTGEVSQQLAQLPAALDTATKSLAAQITAALADARRELGQTIAESAERRNNETLAQLRENISALETAMKARLEKWLAELPVPAPKPAEPPPPHMQAQPNNAHKSGENAAGNNDDDQPGAHNAPPVKKTPKHPPASPRLHEKARPEKPANPLPAEPPPPPETKEEQPAPQPPQPPPQSQPPPPPAPEPEKTPEPKKEKQETPKEETPAEPAKPDEPSEPPAQPEPPPPPPPPARKRGSAKPRPPRDEEPMLDLDLPPPADEYSQDGPEDGGWTTAMSADGVTRLIVTAYIGIGNKLYIRGDGPGLSWDKGVPLQFISIGKWRWETNDAANPVAFKLYKNDSVECTRIGSPKLEPGHQHEVTANF